MASVTYGELIDKMIESYLKIGYYLRDGLRVLRDISNLNIIDNKLILKYSETGLPKCIIDYVDGKFSGRCSMYNELGQVLNEGAIHDSIPISNWNLWNGTQTTNTKLHFDNAGFLSGLQIINNIADNVVTYINMYNDRPHGEFTQYITGKLLCKGDFVHGNKHGIWQLYKEYSRSNASIITQFLNNIELKIPKPQTRYQSQFSVMKRSIEDTDPSKFNLYNERFNIDITKIIINPLNIINNRYTVYYAPNKIHYEIDCYDNKLEGTYSVYYETGHLYYTGFLINSKPFGKCKRYNPIGEIKGKVTFSIDGILTGKQKIYSTSGNQFMFTTINGIKHGPAYYKIFQKKIMFTTVYDNGTMTNFGKIIPIPPPPSIITI
ncbi:MAG: hypothetical protein Gaeavirus13_7 [Gaeavirus sp.]|uniref:MORN repeat-containing protein n=1 Tax=Gaeavirus sp. TaxID=2487767 RepID=A0A3G4ZZ06_9VIRU|nr:MAG: hypothetical protein Gaeavirus13_7 [Gaeavirus sp.]